MITVNFTRYTDAKAGIVVDTSPLLDFLNATYFLSECLSSFEAQVFLLFKGQPPSIFNMK